MKITCNCQLCLSDVTKLFEQDYQDDCAYNRINEDYALAQCFEITICLLALLVIIAKICAINFDNKIVNKLVLYQFVAFFLWTLARLIKSLSFFFVNPSEEYSKYIEPTQECAEPDCTVDDYKKSATYWVTSIANFFENIFLALALSIKLLEWVEIHSLISIQRKHQNQILEVQHRMFRQDEK